MSGDWDFDRAPKKAKPPARRGRNSTATAMLVVGGVLVLGGVVAVVTFLLTRPVATAKPATDVTDNAAEFGYNGAVLLRKSLRLDEENRILGTVVNRRKTTIDFLSIEFTVHDAAGAQVGNQLEFTTGLRPGVEWKFKTGRLPPGTTFKLSALQVQ